MVRVYDRPVYVTCYFGKYQVDGLELDRARMSTDFQSAIRKNRRLKFLIVFTRCARSICIAPKLSFHVDIDF